MRCIFEIFGHKFEKVIEISEDFMLFSEISDFLSFFLCFIEKVKGVEVGQTLLE